MRCLTNNQHVQQKPKDVSLLSFKCQNIHPTQRDIFAPQGHRPTDTQSPCAYDLHYPRSIGKRIHKIIAVSIFPNPKTIRHPESNVLHRPLKEISSNPIPLKPVPSMDELGRLWKILLGCHNTWTGAPYLAIRNVTCIVFTIFRIPQNYFE